jgi:hypothetical protein
VRADNASTNCGFLGPSHKGRLLLATAGSYGVNRAAAQGWRCRQRLSSVAVDDSRSTLTCRVGASRRKRRSEGESLEPESEGIHWVLVTTSRLQRLERGIICAWLEAFRRCKWREVAARRTPYAPDKAELRRAANLVSWLLSV